jgi:hypothetical protein
VTIVGDSIGTTTIEALPGGALRKHCCDATKLRAAYDI